MTEAEFWASGDPAGVAAAYGGKLSRRKQRLALVALCRMVWPFLPRKASRRAVEEAERYADSGGSHKYLEKCIEAAFMGSGWSGIGAHLELAAHWVAPHDRGYEGILDWCLPEVLEHTAGELSARAQADALRDVGGDPFRPPPAFDPSHRTSLLRSLAEDAYSSRLADDGSLDPARLSVLGDALEDLGCPDGVLLRALRLQELCPGCSRDLDTEWYGGGGGWCAYCDGEGPDLLYAPMLTPGPKGSGPGVWKPRRVFRGFWALDLVLGKE